MPRIISNQGITDVVIAHLNTKQFATSVVVKRGGGVTPPLPISFLQLFYVHVFNDDIYV